MKVNPGWGINVGDVTTKNTDGTETTTKNVISLNRNLGTNLDKTGKLDLTVSDTGLVLDTVVPEDLWQQETNHGLNFQHFGATGDYAVTVGGVGSMATGKYSTVSGGYLNTAEGEESAVFGGSLNKASKYNDSVFGGTENVANGSSSSILGGSNNTTSASDSVIVGGNQNATEGLGMNSTVLGGSSNKTSGQYSVVAGGDENEATGKSSSVFGGWSNEASAEGAVASGGQNNAANGYYSAAFGGSNNTVSGQEASVFGGYDNSASGQESAVVGGTGNTATNAWASVFGGDRNTATGVYSAVTGGSKNIVNGSSDFAAGGTNNRVLGDEAASFGGKDSVVQGTNATGVAGGSTGAKANNALAAGYQSVVTTENGTSIGYQSTTNEDGTIAFGHDKGDVSGYTVTWKQKATTANGKYYDANGNEIAKNKYDALKNSDSTYNDYTQAPTITENTYTSAQYNRLVKVADGQKAHDTVVLEQLKPYTKSDASNIGANLKTYTVGDDGETITEAAASDDAKNTNENAWGAALGTGKVADPNATDAEKNGSKQLVTGGTVYNALQQQANDLKVNAGWGINIADEKDQKTGAITKKNVISLNRNLGTKLGTSEKVNLTAGNTGLVLGTVVTDDLLNDSFPEKIDLQNLGATGDYAVTVGGVGNIAKGKYSTALGGYVNRATGNYSSVSGGHMNTASGSYASVSGGWNNTASASYSSVSGGTNNTASGSDSFVAGGYKNTASGQNASIVGGTSNEAKGERSAVFGGSNNTAGSSNSSASNSSVFGGWSNKAINQMAVASGGQNNIASGQEASVFGGENSVVQGENATGIAGGSTGAEAKNALAAGAQSVVTTAGGTAIGYQATTNEDGTIAFGHDKGDVSGYTVTWQQRTDNVKNTDGTTNDYTKTPTIKENTYTSAQYNRLVKVADGQKAHDTVVMEQLTPYTKSNASNIGANLKTYTVSDDGETITEADATAEQKTANKNAWGLALGAGTLSTADAAKNSDQLVTGKTLYNYDAPVAETGKTLTYVSANNTTGQNLSALDSALQTVNTKAGAHTALTVEGGTAAGKDDETNKDVYAGKNILLHESTAANGKVTYDLKLAKDLTSITSISNQTTTGEGESQTTTGAKIDLGSDGNISVNGGKITNVGSGIEKDAAGNITDASKTNAANIGDVQTIAGNATTDLTNKGLKFAANSGDAYTAKLGSTVKIQGTAKKDGHEYTADNLTTEIDNNGNITILMDKNISAEKLAVNGKDGKDGAPGTAGSIGISGQDGQAGIGIDGKDGISIKGKDGKDGVTMKAVDGKDGTEGHIGLTGPAGTNGKDGTNAVDITVKNGYDGTNGVNGKNGVDGTSLTRIVYEDANGEHQVATMEDGLKFKGDDETVIAKKLNNTLDIIGGADSTKLTDSNIGVNSTTDGKLKVQLAKDLQGITSISNQKTEGDKTTGAKITLGTDGNVDVNGGKITNVGSGADASGNYTNTTNAANIGDVQTIAGNATTDLTNKGLKFAANSGDAYTAKLGSTVKIQGTAKKDGHEYTADNLTTEIDKDGNITILMDKNISAEKLAVNGKDGKDGAPGTAGSIGISGQDGQAGIGIDGKDGISIKGKDGKDGVTMKAVDGKDGTEGHIGLTGPAGTNGKDGTNAIDITVKNGYDGTNGVNGKNGVDGTSLTRIVYEDANGEHQVATMEDGLKFKGDDETVIAKMLNNTLDIIGGADSQNLTEGNIGVNSTTDGKLKVQLAKDLQGITSISNQKTEGDKTTGAKIDLGSDGSVDVNGGKITNVGSGADASGSYTNTTNAANIGDVQNIVKDAVDSAADTTNKALSGKANVDASNIGTNLKNADGSAASADAQKANAERWGSAIGTGEIKANDGRMVTGNTVYEYNKPVAEEGKDLNYVSEKKTTGQNLGALDAKVKDNADAITQLNTSISSLDQNAVKYDDSSKSKITLGGEGGTTLTNVKDGSVAKDSKDAVNGGQLYQEQQDRKDMKDLSDTGKTVIKNLSKDAVQVKAGDRIKVDEATDEKTGNKTYTISANNNGTVAKGDGNLISGDTLYKEVHVDTDGSYIKSGNTVGQNLSALDTGLKTTSDLIHTNDKGDTIQIGGSSTATKIDVSGKDANGNTTGRVITGVVSDASDPNSAANVGYVNGLTAANTQQIYRDMNNAYSRLDTNINRAAAGSNALAALHPLDFDPADKASFAVGYGHYHNANAAAVGAFYQPNANTMVNMGISLGNGDPGFNAGVSFKIGKGSAYNGVSKAEMAQTIHDQAAEISTIKANDAAKDKRIDALEKENQEMKKQIQEILARLNG